MDAVVLAAGKLSDPAWTATGYYDLQKALLPVAGRPLLQRVLDACRQARSVRRVVVVGIDAHEPCDAPGVQFLPDTGDLVGNLAAGALELAAAPDARTRVLVVACDVPLITGPMLDWLVERVQNDDLDLHYTVIRKETMEARFPGSKRTYYRVRDGSFCGGDAHIMSLRLINRLAELSPQLVARRKSLLRLAWLAGPVFTLRFLAGLESHDAIRRRIARWLGCTGDFVVSDFAELGMDIDKPEHLRAVLDATA
jgi:CTP:molybdopterin cytidylyltransferase MocA